MTAGVWIRLFPGEQLTADWPLIILSVRYPDHPEQDWFDLFVKCENESQEQAIQALFPPGRQCSLESRK